MTGTVGQSDWPVADRSATDSSSPVFFSEAEWDLIDAVTARIIPTDRDAGAREANVVRFIDRFLSGIDYIYASADGSGFLEMSGKDAEAWTARVRERQEAYRAGIAELTALSESLLGKDFVEASEEEQDRVLETLSGSPKPQPVSSSGATGQGGPPPTNQPVNDEGMGFFDMVALHTRQGFYSDPVYGGNAGHVGWRVIGFPGPESLAATQRGEYSTREYLPPEDWWAGAADAAAMTFGEPPS